MKKVVLILTVIIAGFITFTLSTQEVQSHRAGAPAARTGSPADGGNCTSCHAGSAISNSPNGVITSSIPSTGYVPGQTYTVTGTVTGSGLVRFGFEISPQTVSGTKVGNLVVTDNTNTQSLTSGKYITHTTTGSSGTNSRSWTCNWVAPVAGTGTFKFYGAFNAANNSNTNSGDIIYLATLDIAEAAQINTQPANTSACSGGNATFTVAATGTGITYQWKKNGTTLSNDGHFSGVTTNTLTITNVTGTDADSYTCEVTGSGNTVISNPATLSITLAPTITSDPVSITRCVGQTAVFNVTATGTNPTYQWKRNNINLTNGGSISGATSSQLTISGVALANDGSYTCQVSVPGCGIAISGAAVLTVNPNTAITQQPTGATLCPGDDFTITLAADGANLHYSWKKDGVPQPNTDQFIYVILNAQNSDAASYTCDITGTCGTATSDPAVITINPVTAINTQPAPTQTLCQGSTINLSVAAAGTNLSYQWKRGNTNVGTNSSTLSIPNAQPADGGTYTVTVTGTCGTATSNNAVVNITPTTAITTQPVTQGACSGSNVTFTVAAAGANLSYQWKKGTTPVGTNSPTLTLNGITGADAGNYTVEVTGTCGPMVTSNVAVLSVVNSANIAQQPTAQQVCLGGPLTLTVIGNGGNNTTYQWRRNTNNIIGANSATYTVNNTTANDLGDYDVVITGSCGTVTSNTVSVTGLEATSVNNLATNNALCEGENLTFTVSANGSNLSYQWARNGIDISGQTGTSLVLTNVDTSNIGIYTVTVTGDCGTVNATIGDLSITAPPVITSVSLPLPICVGSAIDYTLTSNGDDLHYQWIKNGTPIPNATDPFYSEQFPVDGDVFSCSIWNDCDSINYTFPAVDIYPIPMPVISQTGNTSLTVTPAFVAYTWLYEGNVVSNSNTQNINTTFEGNYQVIVTDANGCSDTSAIFNMIIEGVAENALPGISIYPNPGNGDVYFNTPANMGSFNVKIVSTTGQLVMDKMVENKQLNIAAIPTGLYTVLITYKGQVSRLRLARE